jgi:hypothetical protein
VEVIGKVHPQGHLPFRPIAVSGNRMDLLHFGQQVVSIVILVW